MAARMRITQIGAELCCRLSKFQRVSAISPVKRIQNGGGSAKSCSSLAPSPTSSSNRFDYRQISPLNAKRVYLVDTLAMVRSLEAQGVPSKQAEAITSAMTLVLDECLENLSQSLISMADMQKIQMIQDTNVSKFKSEVKSSQDHHFTLLQRETEKLRNDIEKMRGELRYEIDKVTAGQRLDLNLERGRIREDLANQSAETSNLTNKLDGELHALKVYLEAAKNEVMKYCIGTLISVAAVGIGMLRMLTSNK